MHEACALDAALDHDFIFAQPNQRAGRWIHAVVERRHSYRLSRLEAKPCRHCHSLMRSRRSRRSRNGLIALHCNEAALTDRQQAFKPNCKVRIPRVDLGQWPGAAHVPRAVRHREVGDRRLGVKKLRPAVLQLRFESHQISRQIGAGIERALTLRSSGKWSTVGSKGQQHFGLGVLGDVRRACRLKAGISRPFSENGEPLW